MRDDHGKDVVQALARHVLARDVGDDEARAQRCVRRGLGARADVLDRDLVLLFGQLQPDGAILRKDHGNLTIRFG